MKKIIASLLTGLLLFSLSASPVLAKPGQNTSAPGIAKSNQAAKNAFSEGIKNRTEQTIQLEQKLQNDSLAKAARAKNQTKIRQEIKEKLAAQNQNQIRDNLPTFSDTDSHWGAKSIKRLAALGIINGYPDGSFKPEGQITQAEALSLIMRVADAEANETETGENNPANAENEAAVEDEKINNVPDWAKNAARIADRHRIINLARFHSHVQATRLQTAVWIAKALGIDPADTSNIPFKDGVLISKEDLGYIIALHDMGIIKGTPDGRFNPNSHITRAEIAAIIERILEKSAAGESEETGSTGITEENTSPSTEQTGEVPNSENTSESSPGSGSQGENSSSETVPAE